MIERSGERTRLMILINFLYIFFTFLYINKMNNNLPKKMNNKMNNKNFIKKRKLITKIMTWSTFYLYNIH
jgi:hypothetical protein